MREAPQVGLEPTTLRLTVGDGASSVDGTEGNAPPTTASVRPGSPTAPQVSPQVVPRYGPAVLRALAAWDDARVAFRQEGAPFSATWLEADRALTGLVAALDAERAAAVPALPDEGERAPQPHRFGGWL